MAGAGSLRAATGMDADALFIPLINGSNQAIWQTKVAPDVQEPAPVAMRTLIDDVLTFTLAYNKGGAFGMLAGEDGPGGIPFHNYQLANLAATAALAVVLFDGDTVYLRPREDALPPLDYDDLVDGVAERVVVEDGVVHRHRDVVLYLEGQCLLQLGLRQPREVDLADHDLLVGHADHHAFRGCPRAASGRLRRPDRAHRHRGARVMPARPQRP